MVVFHHPVINGNKIGNNLLIQSVLVLKSVKIRYDRYKPFLFKGAMKDQKAMDTPPGINFIASGFLTRCFFVTLY